MKTNIIYHLTKTFLIAVACSFTPAAIAQDPPPFWKKLRLGGAVGAVFSDEYTNVSLAPIAIYELNRDVGLGAGLIKDQNVDYSYKAYMYGGSVIGILNPIDEIQLSAELEQLRVNLNANDIFNGEYKDNFWNTALFLGAGYRAKNLIIGIRYNVLFEDDDFVYSTSYMSFVRLYF